jgi:hypothetical protein
LVDEQILAEAKTLTDVEAMAEQALGTRREPRDRQRTIRADAAPSTRPGTWRAGRSVQAVHDHALLGDHALGTRRIRPKTILSGLVNEYIHAA